MLDGKPSARAARVLVVDADDDTRLLWREVLTQCEYVVVEASDGRQALTKVFADTPSLVITERRLPFVDGFVLCEILANTGQQRRCPYSS